MKINISTTRAWRPLWGPMPLPPGAKALGVVRVEGGLPADPILGAARQSHGVEYREGALLRLRTGYWLGAWGALSSLPRRMVEDRLACSRMGSAGGTAGFGASKRRDPAKCREAGKKGAEKRWGNRKHTA